MKFTITMTAFLASAAMAIASPVGQPAPGTMAERVAEPIAEPVAEPVTEVDEDADVARVDYGVCNGTSCKIGIFNYDCEVGKCTVQSGGGDGKPCYRDDKVVCPGRG